MRTRSSSVEYMTISQNQGIHLYSTNAFVRTTINAAVIHFFLSRSPPYETFP
ncbi:hypothetical protein BDV35DRAFT_362665 [Aspergillus flavus]|uniref:Uncharacterized protein n=1 Tax=Aspergillus flavus TaxID=5059 RepID=A0A5N6GMM4_ASPFL|nr:hypothetical protein BDV35DRAFT_362665 [Aspergillus flavus]